MDIYHNFKSFFFVFLPILETLFLQNFLIYVKKYLKTYRITTRFSNKFTFLGVKVSISLFVLTIFLKISLSLLGGFYSDIGSQANMKQARYDIISFSFFNSWLLCFISFVACILWSFVDSFTLSLVGEHILLCHLHHI